MWKVLTSIGIFLITLKTPLNGLSPQEMQIAADRLREEGKSLEAVNLYNQVIAAFQAEGDYESLFSSLTGRLLAWKHLYYKTNDFLYVIFARNEAEAMEEISKFYHIENKLFLIYYLKGSLALLYKEYALAEHELKQALDLYPDEHAQKGNWIINYGEALFLNGNRELGKKTILEGLEKIKVQAHEIDSYLYGVWISGGYLSLASLLKSSDPEESEKYLNLAKELIESDSRLIIRKEQLEALLKKFAS